MRRAVLVVALLVLTRCGTTVLPLTYTPPSDVIASGPPVVGRVTAVDARGESDPRWYGTIRGGYGNPLKPIDADRPIADAVAEAVRSGLAARGLLGSEGGPVEVRVTVQQFESDQYKRREAKVKLLLEWRGGRRSFADAGQADVITGSIVSLSGVFASTADLQATAAQALSQAVDQALDDPALRRFLASAR